MIYHLGEKEEKNKRKVKRRTRKENGKKRGRKGESLKRKEEDWRQRCRLDMRFP